MFQDANQTRTIAGAIPVAWTAMPQRQTTPVVCLVYLVSIGAISTDKSRALLTSACAMPGLPDLHWCNLA